MNDVVRFIDRSPELVPAQDYEMLRALGLICLIIALVQFSSNDLSAQNWGGYGDAYKAIWYGEAHASLNARLLTLAANIKATGVVIYVIQFADGSVSLQNLLKQVATTTSSPYYHYAPDSSSLNAVFTEVANHLSELRLSK